MGKNFQKNGFFKNFNEFCESNLQYIQKVFVHLVFFEINLFN